MISGSLQVVALVLAVLAGLGAAGTYLALGVQRGRVAKLEKANEDLRTEVADEKRRREGQVADEKHKREKVQAALEAAEKVAARDRATIDHLRGEVATMRAVFEAVNGPIADLTRMLAADHEALADHHREAMAGQAALAGQVTDVLRLLGSKRGADGATT